MSHKSSKGKFKRHSCGDEEHLTLHAFVRILVLRFKLSRDKILDQWGGFCMLVVLNHTYW